MYASSPDISVKGVNEDVVMLKGLSGDIFYSKYAYVWCTFIVLSDKALLSSLVSSLSAFVRQRTNKQR